MRRSEVRWYRFARPDKRRPVLVLTRDSIIPYLGEVTVAPITTTIRGTPSEVPLSADDGMPRACAVNCDHLQTVQRGKLGAIVTTLPASAMVRVAEAIRLVIIYLPNPAPGGAGTSAIGAPAERCARARLPGILGAHACRGRTVDCGELSEGIE